MGSTKRSSLMNNRDRFRNIMSFKNVDRYLNIEWGAREETIIRWENEGFKKRVLDGEY